MRRDVNHIWNSFAVAEIIGTILMIGISTSTMAVIYYQFQTSPTPTPTPIVEISGKIDNNQIILMHRGGEPLDLDTELVLNVGGKSKRFKVGDLLDSKSKEDGSWDLSEKLVYDIEYDYDYSDFPKINIKILDGDSDSVLMTGIAKVDPIADIGIEITVDTLRPREFENVTFTITVSNKGNINVTGISIDFKLPEGLSYLNSEIEQGTYNNINGVIEIEQIPVGQSAEIIIIAEVGNVINGEKTQLVFLLDGSASIKPQNFDLMLKGIIAAITDETKYSYKGVNELTIIQFGGQSPAFAQLEIGPIVVMEDNIYDIVNDIMKINQIGDKTPTSCAVYLAADVLKSSDMFDPEIKQVVLLVTDGNPTHGCSYDGDYVADNNITNPKDDVVVARDFMIEYLDLNEEHDEFNAIAVELQGEGHSVDLKDNIVWPAPGYYFPEALENQTITGGWVRIVNSWEEFADSVNESFEIMFTSINVEVKISSTAFTDPREINDISRIILKPKPIFASSLAEVN